MVAPKRPLPKVISYFFDLSPGSTGVAESWPTSRGYLEVYVSAVENAGHFWVQVLGAKSTQLDRLITNMTVHYDIEAEKVVIFHDRFYV